MMFEKIKQEISKEVTNSLVRNQEESLTLLRDEVSKSVDQFVAKLDLIVDAKFKTVADEIKSDVYQQVVLEIESMILDKCQLMVNESKWKNQTI